MKKILLVFAAVIMFASCTKQVEKPADEPVKMSAIELKAKHGIELPFLDYSNSDVLARGRKAKAETITLAVWFNDLTLTESAGVLTTSVSTNAEWGGMQKFFTIDATNNGVSVCNWNWSYVAAPTSITCNANGAGNYRSWTSDKVTYDIHVSAFLPIE